MCKVQKGSDVILLCPQEEQVSVASPPSIYSSFLSSGLLSPSHQGPAPPDIERSQSPVRRRNGRKRVGVEGLASVWASLTCWLVAFCFPGGWPAIRPAHSLSLPLFISKPLPFSQPLPNTQPVH